MIYHLLKLKKKKIMDGFNLIDLVVSSNFLSSKSEFRRAIKNKGIRINNQMIEDEKLILKINSFGRKNILKLSYGKKKHLIIKII